MDAKIRILYFSGGDSDCSLVRDVLKAEPSRFEITEAINSDELRNRLAEGGFDVVFGNPTALEVGLTFSGLEIIERKKEEQELARYRQGLEHLVAERTAEVENRIAEVEKLNRAILNLAADAQEVNADLASTAIELEDVNKELEAFSYSVSHDLRAPLRHIVGFVEILGSQFSHVIGDEGQRYVRLVSESATRMGKLIDDLLTFSRVGRDDLFLAKIDLDQMVREVIEGVSDNATAPCIEWVVNYLPHAFADRATLRQVFVNLLENAVKYSQKEKESRIEIGQLPDERELIIFVKDNGVGFDPAYGHKLFGVFQRLHRVDEFEGTGIGLANVRRIIRRHGGRTWAEGQVNEGATFYFSLPIRQRLDGG